MSTLGEIEAAADALPPEQKQELMLLEDLRDLEAAIAENAGKPLIPWEQVKPELELE